MNFQIEKLRDILSEVQAVYTEHFKVTALHQDKFKSDINWDGYLNIEDAGWLHLVTVRDEAKLIGYLWLMTVPDLNYMSVKMGIADKYYIDKAYWGQGLGSKLLAVSDKYAKDLGVERLICGAKINQGSAPIMMLTKAGYTAAEVFWEKVL